MRRFLIFFLMAGLLICQREIEIKVIALQGADGNYIFWKAPLIPPSSKDLGGYIVLRSEREEGPFYQLNPKPLRCAESPEELARSLSGREKLWMKITGSASFKDLWNRFLMEDKRLLRLSYLEPSLRRALGLAWIDRSGQKGIKYWYKIALVDRRGKRIKVSEPVALIFPQLEGPLKVRAIQKREGVEISWQNNPADQRLLGYRVYRRCLPGERFLKISPIILATAEGSFLDSSVEVDQVCIYCVRSVDIVKNESPCRGNIRITIRDLQPPPPPTDLKAEPVAGGIKLSWSAVEASDLAGYNVYRREKAEKSFKRINKSLVPKSSSPSFTDSSALPGVQYFYRVRAVDLHENESSPSIAVFAKRAEEIPPLPPSEIKAERIKEGVRISWKPIERSVLGYVVFRKAYPMEKPTQISPLLPSKSTFFIDKKIPPSAKGFWYAVASVGLSGKIGEPSEFIYLELVEEKPLPAPVFFIRILSDGVLLNWREVESAKVKGFRIYRKCDGEDEFSLIAEKDLLSPEPYSFLDRSAPAGRSCKYYVVAFDSKGREGKLPKAVQILAPESPLPPPAFLSARIRPEGVEIRWSRIFNRKLKGCFIFRREPGKNQVVYIFLCKGLKYEFYKDKGKRR